MHRVPMWRRYLRFFGRNVAADVRDELRFHLEAKARLLEERGMSPAAARREAERLFGDVGEVGELCRTIEERHLRKLNWSDRLSDWRFDLRHAFRALRMSPGFSLVAILTLTAGIGGAASLFSLVDAWVIRSVRFAGPKELVFIRGLDTRLGRETGVSRADYAEFASRATLLQSLAAWSPDSVTLSSDGTPERGTPERVQAAHVSPNFLATLAVAPARGRSFFASEGQYGNHRVAVVSHDFRAASPGSQIKLNGEPYSIVGVLPDHFQFTLAGRVKILIPDAPSPAQLADRSTRPLQLVGRMKRHADVSRVRQELGGIAAQTVSLHPVTNRDIGVFCLSLSDEIARHVGAPVVLIVFAVTLGLLLISCSNVANLLLVRALGKKRQAAIQIALGAARGRLIRQALLETGILFFASAVLGTLTGALTIRIFTGFIPWESKGYLPDYGEASLNWTVLAFILVITTLTGFAFGLAPALESSDGHLADVLRESGSAAAPGRKSNRIRSALVVGQIALATMLLTSTAVLVGFFQSLASAPTGFDRRHVLTLRLSLDERRYAGPDRKRAFFESCLASLQFPGQPAPAVAAAIPFGNQSGQTGFRVNAGDLAQNASYTPVSPAYFSVLRTPLSVGRSFESSEAHPVAIVNRAFVARYLKGRAPVGQSLLLDNPNRDVSIVGVVADIREDNDPAPPPPEIFVPFAQAPQGDAFLMFRTSGNPPDVMPAIRSRLTALDAELALNDVNTLDERVSEAYAPFRIISGMLLWFGSLALLLAAIGVFGVVSFSVSQGTREIGIRSALGAGRLGLQFLFLREGLAMLVLGLVPGLLGGLAAFFGMRTLLAELVPARVALPMLSMAGILCAAVLLAILLPARRAASIAPLAAIRGD